MSLNTHFNNSTQNKNKIKFIKDNFNYDITTTKNYNEENNKKDFKLLMLCLSVKIIYGCNMEALNVYYLAKIIFNEGKNKNFHIETKNKRSNIHIMDMYNYLMYKKKKLNINNFSLDVGECLICLESKNYLNIICSSSEKCKPLICNECYDMMGNNNNRCPLSRGDLSLTQNEGLVYESHYNNKIIEYEAEKNINDDELIIYSFVKDQVYQNSIYIKTSEDIKNDYIENQILENIIFFSTSFLKSNININFDGLDGVIENLQETENNEVLLIILGLKSSYNVSEHDAKINRNNLYDEILNIDGLEHILNDSKYLKIGETFGNGELQNIFLITEDADISDLIDFNNSDYENDELFYYE